MNNNKNKNKGFSFVAALFIALFVLAGLQACGGSDSTPAPPTDANPTGYYTGTAAVKDDSNTDLTITDFQGMISGDRFLLMSVDALIVYDGSITNITENDFSATVTIYKTSYETHDVTVTTSSVTGTITEGSQITGTFEGVEAWNGTFALVYEQSNSEVATAAQVTTAVGEIWSGQIGFDGFLQFMVDNIGVLSSFNAPVSGVFSGCAIDADNSKITPIVDTRLYLVLIKFITCPNGLPAIDQIDVVYTGLATTKGADNTLVLAFTGGALAASADHARETP